VKPAQGCQHRRLEEVIKLGTRWIKVDAKIVECFRAWEEPAGAAHPWFAIVADITTPGGQIDRVEARQRLYTRTHHWRAPDPGDVVPARWNRARGMLKLDLDGDPRYDERVIKMLGRTQAARSHVPPGPGGGVA
jgi:hypothetical protein